MYVNAINDLMGFLEGQNPDDAALCRHLATQTLRMLGVNGVLVCEVTEQGTIVTTGSYGVKDVWPEFPLDTDVPIAESLRTNRMVWLSDMKEMEANYPALGEYSRHTPKGTVITWPIQRLGSPVGAIAIFAPDTLFPNPTTEAFLRSVGALVSLNTHLTRTMPHTGPTVADQLTDRQLQILIRISRGDTNSEIANLIGYSESTVRQETMRLFDKLEVANRREAREFYIANKALFDARTT
jgi:DNA-binding CsgD family transcriptional regulator